MCMKSLKSPEKCRFKQQQKNGPKGLNTLPSPTPRPKKKKKPNTVLYTNSMGESGFPTLGECVFVFTALNMENVHSY